MASITTNPDTQVPSGQRVAVTASDVLEGDRVCYVTPSGSNVEVPATVPTTAFVIQTTGMGLGNLTIQVKRGTLVVASKVVTIVQN